MVIVEKKEKISMGMWVMRCPKCGKVVAGASERYLLPVSTWCNCDAKIK